MGRLCLDFINTRWYINHKLYKDIIKDQTLLREFLTERQIQLQETIKTETVAEFIALRSFLGRVLESYVREGVIAESDLAGLNYYLGEVSASKVLKREKNEFRLIECPVALDCKWLRAEIVASFAELIAHGDKSRLKICENPDCGWVFYDETKSRTKRWCDDTCASLMKVRKFRAKQKN